MAADETVYKIGDNDNNLLRKILQVLRDSPTSGVSGDPLQVEQSDLNAAFDSVTVKPSDGTVAASSALAASLVLKSSAGKLLMLIVHSTKGSSQFIQIHNAAALPGNGAVPIFSVTVAAGATFVFPVPILTGVDFSTGITVANSSTAATLTVGSADCWFTGVVI